MAPPDDDTPSPFSSLYDQGATNPALAAALLQRHQTEMDKRAPDIDNVLSKMQMSTDTMSKMLEDTTNAIKTSRQSQMSLPLMAMAAGMLSSRGPFGQQLGEGFGAMVPTIQKQREQDQQLDLQLAQLGMRKAMIEQAPLEARLAYMKALQTGDQGAVRAIEQALIRSQAMGQNNAANNPKLIQKTVQDSLAEARKQADAALKDADVTPEEKDAEARKRFTEIIRAHRASGIPIPEGVESTIFGGQPGGPAQQGQTPGVGIGPYKFKSYFDSPNTPEREQKTLEAGLPAAPENYTYDLIGRTERTKKLLEESKNWQKESKDFDDASKTSSDLLAKYDQAEAILKRNPHVVGLQGGLIPNNWTYNMSTDATTLNGLFQAMQLHSIPKGQGAVSDMERRLFANAGPNMNINAAANLELIKVGREIAKRDKDRREFFSSYFNNYKTTDGMVAAWDRYINSDAGSALKRDDNGNMVVNTNRTNWRDFFKTERGAGNRRDGGYIKLGNEYD